MSMLRTVIVLSMLLYAGQAHAHAHLTSSTPAADAKVSAPASLELHFSEAVSAKSTVEIKGPGDKAVALKPLALKAPKIVVITPAAPLSAGTHTVTWIAVAAENGHKTTGTYAFTVE